MPPSKKKAKTKAPESEPVQKAFEHYRECALGMALEDVLDDMDEFDEDFKRRIKETFDISMMEELKKLQNKVEIKGTLKSYNHSDNVWRVLVSNATFRAVPEGEFGRSELVQVLACKDPESDKKPEKKGATSSSSAPKNSSSSSKKRKQ
jgi:hypothetical protein